MDWGVTATIVYCPKVCSAPVPGVAITTRRWPAAKPSVTKLPLAGVRVMTPGLPPPSVKVPDAVTGGVVEGLGNRYRPPSSL